MKISDVKIYTLDAFRTNWAFIKVETDEGLYGWERHPSALTKWHLRAWFQTFAVW